MNTIDPTPPPTVLQAEQAWLGSLLQHGRTAWIESGPIAREFFADPRHVAICGALVRCLEAEQPVNGALLAGDPDVVAALADLGADYLTQIAHLARQPDALGEIASAVRGAWLQRGLIEIGETLVREGFAARLTGGELLELAESKVSDLRFLVGGAE